MRSFIFHAMVVLMIVWTSLFLMELTYMYFGSEVGATINAGAFNTSNLNQLYAMVREDFWSTAAAARVAVWALPMLFFAVITAVTQPPPGD